MTKYMVLWAFLAGFFISPAAGADMVIGLAGPMSGPAAEFGAQIRHGVEAAAETINTHGGVNGHFLKLRIEDDACDPKQARLAANRLAQSGVAVVIGHWCAMASMAAAPVYGENNILMLEPGSLLTALTRQNFGTVFRFSAREKDVARKVVETLKKRGKTGKVAVIASRHAIAQDMGKHAVKLLADAGIEAGFKSFVEGEQDYAALVTALKASAPDAVFCSCYTADGARIVRQAKASGLKTQFISFDFASGGFARIVGVRDAEGVLAIDYARPPRGAKIKALDNRLRRKNIEGESYLYLAHAALDIYAQASARAKSLDPEKIASVLKREEFESVVGKVRFADNGDRLDPGLSAYVWKNGVLQPLFY